MRFNEERHVYTNDEGKEYKSATSFIKSYTIPFDRINIAKKYAKKNKKTVEEVLAEWEKAGDDAIKKGTAYHKIQEDILLEQEEIVIGEDSYLVFKPEYDGSDKVNKSLKLEPGIYPELIVWSDKYEIAGQADRVEITNNGYINIRDYKTSKEIRKEAFRRWDGSYDRMKGPFAHLDDCNFNHYSLQLNLYAFLIRQHNRKLKVGSMTIDHVICDYNEETGQIEVKEVIEYSVSDLQLDIKAGLEDYKSKMNDNII